ncbi:alpha/beta hydrolase [Phaeodactylibacter sp.]|uniref:alpha/beta fold hydrolase n=1 Tax=Phaeodactylibacter sp. TaxID=1940289 RepID=UPI0025F3E04C|nr:alpha/beta hydrolase [Phaeodactylibacter sp.]MCI4651082.1 alpha/beta hydrolase [Phaeodactylibacter sp.]MCI5092110.1 alpha/beta hydrolase [Phaeodactylibacter sp.]
MKEIKIRGNRFFYEDINPEKEEVVLLVHGHPFDHSMWKYQYEELNNFRLILPDLKGYGKSDYDFDKIYIEEQALDLAILLDELKIEKVHLIGLSMGGQIIVEFHRLFPIRVQSLIICASLPNAETEESYKSRLRLADEISEIGMLEYTKRDIHKYINLNEIEATSEVYIHLFKMMSETKKEGAIASHRGRAERRNNLDYLKKIKTPTLVIAGEMDFFFKAEEVEKIANEITDAEFKLVKKSGHLPNMEKPQEFNKLIKDFYGK